MSDVSKGVAPAEVFDRSAALRYAGDDPGLLRELTQIFLEDAPQQLAGIRAGLGAQDPVAVRAASHSLKGSAKTMGAQEVADLAQELETLGRLGDLTNAPERLRELEEAFARLATVLEECAPS